VGGKKKPKKRDKSNFRGKVNPRSCQGGTYWTKEEGNSEKKKKGLIVCQEDGPIGPLLAQKWKDVVKNPFRKVFERKGSHLLSKV